MWLRIIAHAVIVYIFVFVFLYACWKSASQLQQSGKDLIQLILQCWLSVKIAMRFDAKTIGPLNNTITWYKISYVGRQIAHWGMGLLTTKQLFSLKLKISSFWISQCAVCHPAWQILNHMIVLCKGAYIIARLVNGQFPLWDAPAGNHGSYIHQLPWFPAGASHKGNWPFTSLAMI